MATNVYTVDFTVTLSKCIYLPATSEEEALDLACRLLRNDEFRLRLIESWDEPYSGWSDPNDPVVLCGYDGDNILPDYTLEELREYYGLEVTE